MFNIKFAFLAALGIWATIAPPLWAQNSTPQPMNVLILYADDWRHDTLGSAGHPVVKTPELDQLAKQGVRFANNYVTTSICGVSRASMLTGQWMSQHGNRSFSTFKTPWSQTFPAVLRDNGYYLGHVGKWYTRDLPENSYDFVRLVGGTHWIKQPDGSQIHVTQKNENDALEFLKTRPQDKPFCLTVAFFATHAQDNAPEQYLPQPSSAELYQDVVIPVPKTATDEHFARLPPFINDQNEGRNRWRWRFDTPERYQTYMTNYFRLVSEVDASCGRILAELQSQGLDDNTLVIFTTDNGYFHAEHGLADKWYPYEESIRVPLIVRDPRMPEDRKGQVNSHMTLNVDLAPTVLAATAQPIPSGMQGQDFSQLYLRSTPVIWRTDFYYEHDTIRNKEFIPASEALVSNEWKYILWPEFEYEELFHLVTDPHEEQNIAKDPKHLGRLEQQRLRFAELKAEVLAGADREKSE